MCGSVSSRVFGVLQVARVTLFYVDTVGPLYLLLGLAAVFIVTQIMAAKF